MKRDAASPLSRRTFLTASTGVLALPAMASAQESAPKTSGIITPPEGKQILLSPKLGMLPKELKGKKLSLAERLSLAGEAGFDGVDFDQAGEWTPEEARAAVSESGVFVHNAINHAHWRQRLTSASPAPRPRNGPRA